MVVLVLVLFLVVLVLTVLVLTGTRRSDVDVAPPRSLNSDCGRGAADMAEEGEEEGVEKGVLAVEGAVGGGSTRKVKLPTVIS
jgi:hypothetical protein